MVKKKTLRRRAQRKSARKNAAQGRREQYQTDLLLDPSTFVKDLKLVGRCWKEVEPGLARILLARAVKIVNASPPDSPARRQFSRFVSRIFQVERRQRRLAAEAAQKAALLQLAGLYGLQAELLITARELDDDGCGELEDHIEELKDAVRERLLDAWTPSKPGPARRSFAWPVKYQQWMTVLLLYLMAPCTGQAEVEERLRDRSLIEPAPGYHNAWGPWGALYAPTGRVQPVGGRGRY